MSGCQLSIPLPQGTYVITLPGTLVPPPPPPPPPTDLQKAQAFFRRLTVGANVERLHYRELVFNGAPIGSSPAYWLYLANCGITHIRFFLPWGFGGAASQLTQADVLDMVGVIKQALAAGLTVMLDLVDVLDIANAGGSNGALLLNWLKLAAGVISQQGFDPARFATGAVNEPAGGASADWAPFVAQWHDVLRTALPGYVLLVGFANWKYYGKGLNPYDNSEGLATATALADDLIGYDVHDYDPPAVGASADLAATWANAARVAQAWSVANGNKPVFLGEYGWSDPAGIAACALGAGTLRPTAWTISSGSAGRMNVSSTDATLQPAVAQQLQLASGYIRAQPYYQAA